jgi:hypothetical protein
MPSALNTKIRALETEIQLFGNDLFLAYQHAYNCAVYLNAEGNPNSSTQMYGLANDLYALFGHWSGTSSDIKYNLIWALDYINNFAFNGGGNGVTMGDILAEMLSATFDELTSFMGITQAYKVAVWDAPFNEAYYAALARGFKSWGR